MNLEEFKIYSEKLYLNSIKEHEEFFMDMTLGVSQEQIEQCNKYLRELPKLQFEVTHIDDNGNEVSMDGIKDQLRKNFEEIQARQYIAGLRILNFIGVNFTETAFHRLIGKGVLRSIWSYVSAEDREWLSELLKANGYKDFNKILGN